MNISTQITTHDEEEHRCFIFENETTTLMYPYELYKNGIWLDYDYYTINQLISNIRASKMINFDEYNNIEFTDTNAIINVECEHVGYNMKIKFELNEFTEKFIKHLNELV